MNQHTKMQPRPSRILFFADFHFTRTLSAVWVTIHQPFVQRFSLIYSCRRTLPSTWENFEHVEQHVEEYIEQHVEEYIEQHVEEYIEQHVEEYVE